MAIKSGAYNKFKAIQQNNEEIAQQDFAGLRRVTEGWTLTGATANGILGGQPLLKAGGTGAKILDLAANEPQPQTTGQAILKAAGQWKPLNQYYASGGTVGSQPESTKEKIADLTAEKRAQPETVSATPVTTDGVASVENSNNTENVTSSVNKTYTVNGSQITLGEYIKSLGADPDATYRQSVAEANAAYDRQRATYGAEAEALAGQGLGKSGTSDYLDASAYAAKQKAISQAAATRDATKTALAGQYSSYLQQERAAKQEQIQTALDRAATMQLNSANTVKYLMAMTGMTKSEAEQYAEGTAALLGTTEADTTQATLQEITQEYARLVSTDTENGGAGMSDAAARAYLKGAAYGYDAALVDQAANELVGAYEQTKADNLAASQQAVSEVFEKSISIWDGATAQAKLAEQGIEIPVDEETGMIGLRDFREAIAQAYNNEMLSEEQYLALMMQNADEALNPALEEGQLNDALQVAVDMHADKQIQRQVLNKIATKISDVTVTDEEDVTAGTIEFELDFNGEKIEIEYETEYAPESVAKELRKMYPGADEYQTVVMNGDIYVFGVGEGESVMPAWYKVNTTVDGWGESYTDEQSAMLYKIIADKLSLRGSAGAIIGAAQATKKKQ